MIKNQWYAVLQSKDIPAGKVTGAKRLGLDLVFYRDRSGSVCCASDRCPHRNAALSLGCMKEGALQCPDENSIISLRFYNRISGIRMIDSIIAWFGKWANKVIERQDKRVVETQRPKFSSLYSGENLVQADFPIMEYRNKRETLKRQGSM